MAPFSRLRFPLLALAMFILVLATLAGLGRIGWVIPSVSPSWIAAHGVLMVAGFLGTLIGLERAVALGKKWMYLGPAFAGLGGLALLVGFPLLLAQSLIILGSLGLLVIYVQILRQHFASFTVIMAVGAVCGLIGNVTWLAVGRIPQAIPWWTTFLILTIAGERLELGRLTNIPTRVLASFILACGILLIGCVISWADLRLGGQVSGVGIVGIALWLLRYDIARRTIRKPGLTRFIAICMLAGYIWLTIGGVLTIFYAGWMAGPPYDAQLHAIFLGFVFSMIFGHAPIIFPSVLGRPIHFSPSFYLHLGVLHASLIVRIIGNLFGLFALRRWGGLLNGIAILIFLVNSIMAVRKEQKS